MVSLLIPGLPSRLLPGPFLLSYSVLFFSFPYLFFVSVHCCSALDQAGYLISFWAHVNLPYRILSRSKYHSNIIKQCRPNGMSPYWPAVECRPPDRRRARRPARRPHAPVGRPAGPPAALQTPTDNRRQRAKQHWPNRRASNEQHVISWFDWYGIEPCCGPERLYHKWKNTESKIQFKTTYQCTSAWMTVWNNDYWWLMQASEVRFAASLYYWNYSRMNLSSIINNIIPSINIKHIWQRHWWGQQYLTISVLLHTAQNNITEYWREITRWL